MHLGTVLADTVPTDSARQAKLTDYLSLFLENSAEGISILDLGCGSGNLVATIMQLYPGVECFGVDIAESPEVLARTASSDRLLTFDGVSLPFGDESFDFVVSRQVLEHVEYPRELLADVARVLKRGGRLFGSTSQLEPYHSFSTFNYTPYGLLRLADTVGLDALEFRPGPDVTIMIVRRLFRRRGWVDRWLNRESPVNRLLGWASWLGRRSARQVNLLKLMFAGQFFFVLRKP